jgi:uncharacterized protein DUF3592
MLAAAGRSDLWVGLLFALIGLGLLVIGCFAGAAKQAFIRDAAAAEGSVTRVLAGGTHPGIEFVAGSGKTIVFPQGGWTFGYRPGERVRVLYDPGAPTQSACVDSFGTLWFTPLLLAALGLLLLTGGILKAAAAFSTISSS